jgi:hypothetical protein
VSKGHGRIQQTILAHTQGWDDIRHSSGSRKLRVTARTRCRCARRSTGPRAKLADEELIEIYYLDVPTAVSAHGAPTNRRDVVCATRCGYGEQLTDEDWDVCRGACEEIYALASILCDAFSKEFSQ